MSHELPQPAGLPTVERRRSSRLPALFRRRWWWNVTIVATLAISAIQLTLESNWMWFRHPWNVVVGSILLIVWLSFAGWLFVALPVLCATDRRPQWQAVPRVYLDALRWLVWAPAVLIAGSFVAEILFFSVLPGLESGSINIRIPKIIIAFVILIIGFAVGYAILMQRYLRVRIRDMARARRMCFECGYPLHSITGARCPECGTVSESE